MKYAIALLLSDPYRRKDTKNEFYEQEMVCRRYAANSGIHIVDIYRDKTYKNKIKNRLVLKAAIRYATDKKNGISVILVTNIKNISRNNGVVGTVMSILKTYGVKIVTAKESDLSTTAPFQIIDKEV